MKKERKVTETIIFFDRDVPDYELNEFCKNFEGNIVIANDLLLYDGLDISCSLFIMGGINFEDKNKGNNIRPEVNIHGDLYCEYINCYDINVYGSLYCREEIDSTTIKIAGDLICNSIVNSNVHKITVAGDFECDTCEADEIIVLGNFKSNYCNAEFGVKTYGY